MLALGAGRCQRAVGVQRALGRQLPHGRRACGTGQVSGLRPAAGAQCAACTCHPRDPRRLLGSRALLGAGACRS
jgi:hypothetical protein